MEWRPTPNQEESDHTADSSSADGCQSAHQGPPRSTDTTHILQAVSGRCRSPSQDRCVEDTSIEEQFKPMRDTMGLEGWLLADSRGG
jgi:hypothetical protein